MEENEYLSLPCHQWKKIQCTGPEGKTVYDLWFWICTDCHQSTAIAETPDEPMPPRDPCLGKGPHNAHDIALVRLFFEMAGWQMPERLREE